MTDVLTYIGEETIQALLPGVVSPLLAAEADLQAKIAALVGFSATVSLSVGAQITLAESILASLQVALSLGIEAPSIQVQIDAVAALLVAIRAELQLIEDLFGLLAAAGVHAWAYDGTASGFGATLSTALATGLPGGGGPAEHINALVFATSVSATWTAMGEIFRTTP
jgi:hypothetical protein